MQVLLGRTLDEKNKITKTFTTLATVNGVLKEESSVKNPVITFELSNPSNYNYAQIPAFGRYYWIDDITSVRNGIWRISMTVDPLKSFSSQILQLSPIIERTSDASHANKYINDGSLATDTRIQHIIRQFTPITGWNPSGGKFVLMTAGAPEEEEE